MPTLGPPTAKERTMSDKQKRVLLEVPAGNAWTIGDSVGAYAASFQPAEKGVKVEPAASLLPPTAVPISGAGNTGSSSASAPAGAPSGTTQSSGDGGE